MSLPQEHIPFFMPIPPTGDRLEFLSDYHTKDGRWDTSKSQSDIISAYYAEFGLSGLSERIDRCANTIGAVLQSNSSGDVRLRVRSVYLCHVRHCMVCQKARTMAWYRRFQIGLPKLFLAYPKVQYLLLTLTIKNCPIENLRENLNLMSAAFGKLMKRRSVARVLLGYVRTMEVTKSTIGEAHPHFHILLAVKPCYFGGTHYISHEEWLNMWKESLGVDYRPRVDIRKIKLYESAVKAQVDVAIDKMVELYANQDVNSAVVEVTKYQVKGSDLIGKGTKQDKEWLIKLTEQLDHTKQINMAGIFREFIKDTTVSEREAFKASLEENPEEFQDLDQLFFKWLKFLKRYGRIVN